MIKTEFTAIAPKCSERRISDRSIARTLISVFFNSVQIDRTIIACCLGISKLVIEDDLVIDTLIVSSKGRRRKLSDPLVLEAITNRCPSRGRDMMRLVHDQIRTGVDQNGDSGLVRCFKGIWKCHDDICVLNKLRGLLHIFDPCGDNRDARASDIFGYNFSFGQDAECDELFGYLTAKCVAWHKNKCPWQLTIDERRQHCFGLASARRQNHRRSVELGAY